jgi:hypothetical protein
MKARLLLICLFFTSALLAQEFNRPYQSGRKPEFTSEKSVGTRDPNDSTVFEIFRDPVVQKAMQPFWKIAKEGFWSLRNTAVVSGLTRDATGSIYSDLLTDTMGLWKLSFASALVSSNNDTIRDLQTFLTGGGNAILKGAYPVFLWSNVNNPGNRNLGVYFMPRVALNLPALGGSSNGFTYNADLGAEAHLYLQSGGGLIALTGKARAAILTGSNNYIRNFVSDGKSTLTYAQFSAGMLLKQTVLIQATFPMSLSKGASIINSVPPGITVGFVF